DLRGLADEAQKPRRDPRPRPVANAIHLLDSDELPVSDGSTMIDAVEPTEAPAAPKQTRRRGRPRETPSLSPKPPSRKVSRVQENENQAQRSRERLFAIILVGLLGVLLLGAIWIFANIDAWIGGGDALPSPGHAAKSAHGIPQPM